MDAKPEHWTDEYYGDDIPFPVALVLGFAKPHTRTSIRTTIIINTALILVALSFNTWIACFGMAALTYFAAHWPTQYYYKHLKHSHYVTSLVAGLLLGSYGFVLLGTPWWFLTAGVLVLLLAVGIAVALYYGPVWLLEPLLELFHWRIVVPVREYLNPSPDTMR